MPRLFQQLFLYRFSEVLLFDYVHKYLAGPVPSLRLEILRMGLEDYDYMMLLEKQIKIAKSEQHKLVKRAQQSLKNWQDIFVNEREYNKDAMILMKHRQQMGQLLQLFTNKL